MHELLDEFGPDLSLTWRSFLLRPAPEPDRDLEKFRRYTESWQRAAAEEPDGCSGSGRATRDRPRTACPRTWWRRPPRTFGREPFEQMHRALLHAYFAENRDISRAPTLRALWVEVGLPDAELDRVADPGSCAVGDEHNEALELGVAACPRSAWKATTSRSAARSRSRSTAAGSAARSTARHPRRRHANRIADPHLHLARRPRRARRQAARDRDHRRSGRLRQPVADGPPVPDPDGRRRRAGDARGLRRAVVAGGRHEATEARHDGHGCDLPTPRAC